MIAGEKIGMIANSQMNEFVSEENSDSKADKFEQEAFRLLPGLKRSREKLNDGDGKKQKDRKPFVWQYDAETLQPINMFKNIMTVSRVYKFSGINLTNLNFAVEGCWLYHGFRWAFSPRDTAALAPTLSPTVQVRRRKVDFVAMLDPNQMYILNVYPDSKTATESNKILLRLAGILKAIKTGTHSGGYYWRAFEDCPKEMRDEYLKTNTLPEKIKTARSVTVQKINRESGEVEHEYRSITEATVQCQISRDALKKYAANGQLHHGYKWRIIRDAREETQTSE